MNEEAHTYQPQIHNPYRTMGILCSASFNKIPCELLHNFIVNQEKPTVSDNSGPESILTSSEQEQFNKVVDKRQSLEAVNLEMDYTPQDIAEYIFWTGDERGVALTLNDFLQDGLVSFICTISDAGNRFYGFNR